MIDFEYKLAIVIPAYKERFLKETIESIANQTCKDFTLYIGDDASPSCFHDLINLYKDKITIVYRRFDENIGGRDLVAHWNRCIDMVRNEEWIWLFSDDDTMDKNCVELFYEHIEMHQEDALLHFDLQVVDENSHNLYNAKPFPLHCSAAEFFFLVLNRKVFSTVVEYIFKKDIFEGVGRFESFDLAWSSDVATWIKMSMHGGIHTIKGAIVKWRVSSLNISAISDDKSIVLRKAQANVDYLNWAKRFFIEHNLIDTTTEIEKVRWLLIVVVYTTSLNFQEKYKVIVDSLENLHLKKIKPGALLFWLFEEFRRKVKYAIGYKV